MKRDAAPALLALPARVTSRQGEVRLEPILALPAVLAELGVDPARAFARAGVNARLFDDPESRMPIAAVGRLLDLCVELTGCAHFGLLVGDRFRLSNLGPLGYLMLNSATAGAALHSLQTMGQLYDRGAAIVFSSDGPAVTLGYSIFDPDTPGSAQIFDAAIAIGNRILMEMCGPSWKPLHVQLMHGNPRAAAPFRNVFRSSIEFDAETSGIVFDVSWLGQAVAGADARLHDVLAKAMADAKASARLSFADQVRNVLHQLVLSGSLSAEAAARAFSIHERTLRRRLEEEGTTFQQLVGRTRFELAQQLLRDTDLSITRVAATLQYADSNVFSRAFRSWANQSPTQWRAANARKSR